MSQCHCLMNWREYLTVDPTILAGKPVIRGSRLSVDFILGLLGEGWDQTDILRNYPGIQPQDIAACHQYASEMLASERIYPLPVLVPA